MIMVERKLGLVRRGIVLLFTVGLSLLSFERAFATHLRAGQITVTRVGGCFLRTYDITITVYTDLGSPVRFGGEQDVLDFGDGTRMFVPEKSSETFPGSPPNVGRVIYTKRHTYAGPGKFIISYHEPNRNEGVLNIYESVFTTFYIETLLDLTVLGCNSSPILEIPPIDQACSGVAFEHNPGARDPDGDSLSYEFVIPFANRNQPVVNYRDPNIQEFYPGINYQQANEDGTGPPTFAIDAIEGTVTWNAPGAAGEYNIAFIVKEWREINGVWTEIGFVRRDMQIIVSSDCLNERPMLQIPEDVCVEAGTLIQETITGTDPENQHVKIEAFSEIFDATAFDPAATINPKGIFQPSPAGVNFVWQTECPNVKDQPYLVVFKITDKPGPIPPKPPLVSFETWSIKVVAPAPVLKPVTLNLGNRSANIEWEPYDCYIDASKMQIWRRVDDAPYTPGDCDTGMPESLGYTLIAEVPVRETNGTPRTTYLDTNAGKGLPAGAKYCYRLVAVFPQPRGGESKVSNEECAPPLLTSEPVITKVSVETTGENDGEIRIEWTPPLGVTSFPLPYEYQIQRLEGSVFVSKGIRATDLFFVDQGLNSFDEPYTYRVLLYGNGIGQAVDTSATASSVWLDLNAQRNADEGNRREINLEWSAQVPWSMQVPDNPVHVIYRGDEGATTLADLQMIDVVNVMDEGFKYTDTGKDEQGDSLKGSKVYCYAVETRGSYGVVNPDIPGVLINVSQINCIQPNDNQLPCKPQMIPFASCEDYIEEYGCDASVFVNTVRWTVPDQACKEDIRYYVLQVASRKDAGDEGFFEIKHANGDAIRDTFFIHNDGLSGLRYCYRVASVDRSGNMSEWSSIECNDNCPHYELPNVFSPNGDGCNDFFSAYGVDLNLGESPRCPENVNDLDKCARFVNRVEFTVFNRWGRKVYHYVGQEGSENTIYINWDGRDEKGQELATAVYYYTAKVTLDVLDPSDRTRLIKGWVHLVR